MTETDANVFMPQEVKQQMASLTANEPVGKLKDVARAVSFAASGNSNFVTGTYIPVDGDFV